MDENIPETKTPEIPKLKLGLMDTGELSLPGSENQSGEIDFNFTFEKHDMSDDIAKIRNIFKKHHNDHNFKALSPRQKQVKEMLQKKSIDSLSPTKYNVIPQAFSKAEQLRKKKLNTKKEFLDFQKNEHVKKIQIEDMKYKRKMISRLKYQFPQYLNNNDPRDNQETSVDQNLERIEILENFLLNRDPQLVFTPLMSEHSKQLVWNHVSSPYENMNKKRKKKKTNKKFRNVSSKLFEYEKQHQQIREEGTSRKQKIAETLKSKHEPNLHVKDIAQRNKSSLKYYSQKRKVKHQLRKENARRNYNTPWNDYSPNLKKKFQERQDRIQEGNLLEIKKRDQYDDREYTIEKENN